MKQFTYLISFLLLISCKNESIRPQSDNQIKIDPNKKELFFDIKQAQFSETIPLESTEHSLLGNIDKMLIKNNHMYILDKKIAEAIFVFDEKGKFIYKIDRSGQGPGEYSSLDDFTIDEKTGSLLILDADQRKILYFEGSTFTHEKKIPYDISFISSNGENFIGVTNYCDGEGQECHHVLLFDNDFNLIKKEESFVYDPQKIEWDLRLPLFTYAQKNFYTKSFSNYIKLVNEDSVRNFVHIDFGSNNLPENVLNYDRQKLLDYLKKEKNVAYLIDNFMMDENLVYFNFFYNQKLLSAFVSTEDFSKNRLFHNIITMEKVSLTPLYMHGGFIYFVMDSMQMENQVDTDSEDSHTMESNPILLKVSSEKIAGLFFSN